MRRRVLMASGALWLLIGASQAAGAEPDCRSALDLPQPVAHLDYSLHLQKGLENERGAQDNLDDCTPQNRPTSASESTLAGDPPTTVALRLPGSDDANPAARADLPVGLGVLLLLFGLTVQRHTRHR